jgi:hypothetical protein
MRPVVCYMNTAMIQTVVERDARYADLARTQAHFMHHARPRGFALGGP